MSHLWHNPDGTGLSVQPLSGEPVVLSGGPGPRVVPAGDRVDPHAVRLEHIPAGSGTGEPWYLFCEDPAGLWVNGLNQCLGMYQLADGDEIHIERAGTFVFSTETRAAVEAMPDLGNELFCARCKTAIEPGSPAVHCPGCGFWHHQSEDLPCWTYGPACAMCPQETDMEAGFRRIPHGL